MDSPTNTSSPGGKIERFVKKNKTLSAVIGLGAAYFGYRAFKNKGAEEVSEEESPAFAGNGEGPLMPSEISNEAVDKEIERTEEEREEERERREQEKELEEENAGKAKEKSEREVEEAEERGEKKGEPSEPGGGGYEPSSPESPSESPIETPGQTNPTNAPGISIHGKFFPNATKSSIVNSGSTEGGKKYIEYAIYYPGKVEHWQYFTASGNWRVANDSSTNPGSNGGKSGSNPPATKPSGGKRGGGTGNHGGGAIGENKPVTPVHGKKPGGGTKTGGRSGGAGGRKEVGGGGGNGGGGGGGGAPSCPAGTVQNIQQNRSEVQRLTGEIQQLKQWINEHPRAQQRGQWEGSIRAKEDKRNECQGAVDRGRQVPGCGNV